MYELIGGPFDGEVTGDYFASSRVRRSSPRPGGHLAAVYEINETRDKAFFVFSERRDERTQPLPCAGDGASGEPA